MKLDADIVIVGAGIAGASLAFEAADHVSVLILEAEEQPGYHTTGRSAAFWSESYGGPLVQPLTSASWTFLAEPRSDFHDRSFLSSRGAIHLAHAASAPVLEEMWEEFRDTPVVMERLDREALVSRLSRLREGWNSGLSEPSCTDIDVAALHGAYLRSAKAKGARLLAHAAFERAERNGNGWTIETPEGTIAARIIVNAAGAWADEVARRAGERPIGIQPYRRTIAQLRVDPPAPADLPVILDAACEFYFKPEAGGRIWLSPHDETACDPCDCAPEEYDVALAIDRFQNAFDWPVERVEHSWAGLRSFAPDRLPVYGYAAGTRDFFWCAGQGGFGIQTAPAAAKLAASLLLGRAPDPLVAHIDPKPYLAERFAT
jgi:D-arginine dehydrogenase